MNYFIVSVLVLGVIALIASVVLYICSRKFAVVEDERISKVSSLLPQANCGGCGYPGCSGFADALVKTADAGNIEGMSCPVGGSDVMDKISSVLGISSADVEPHIAVVKCAGTCDQRTNVVVYDGLRTCAAVNMCGAGETACGYGCLGCGDCVDSCRFGAININNETGIAEIDSDKCTGCGACAKICPRHVIEICVKGPKDRLVYIACMNKDKGAVALKSCGVSCIGCGRCVKECSFEAISIKDSLAYIDYSKCRLCRKCEKVCVRNAVRKIGFPLNSEKHDIKK